VIEDAETNGCFLYFGWWHQEPNVAPLRRYDTEKRRILSPTTERTHKNDWSFTARRHLLCYTAVIARGVEGDVQYITVKGKKALTLLKIQDRLRAELKAKNKRAKIQKKMKKLDAQWL
jgi:hypothetical protein